MNSILSAAILPIHELIQNSVQNENQQIEVKGYLYRDKKGNLILTDTPNMKSCCFGKGEITEVKVSGSFPEALPAQLSVVKGTLKIRGAPHLEEAELVSSAHSLGVPVFLLSLFFLIFFTSRFLKRRR